MNDVTSYVWKDKRLTRDKSEKQIELRMVDMDEEQLNQIYTHCKNMLYNTDKANLGRMVVIDQIKEQMDCCGAELALRWFKSLKDNKGELIYSNSNLLSNLRAWVNAIPNFDFSERYTLGDLVEVPTDLKDVPVDLVMKACKDLLGNLDHSKITYNFLYKLGIYFTQAELRELEDWGGTKGTLKSKIEDLKLQLGIENAEIHPNPFGLAAEQLRDMIHMKRLKGFKTCKYSQLTTSQLETLRKKVLYSLEELVLAQTLTWKKIMSQIEEVAAYKGIKLQ